jgi:hypothetical protein
MHGFVLSRPKQPALEIDDDSVNRNQNDVKRSV